RVDTWRANKFSTIRPATLASILTSTYPPLSTRSHMPAWTPVYRAAARHPTRGTFHSPAPTHPARRAGTNPPSAAAHSPEMYFLRTVPHPPPTRGIPPSACLAV